MSFFKDCYEMQNKYKHSSQVEFFSELNLFSQKYCLTDWQGLCISRGEMDPAKVLDIGKHIEHSC